MLIIPTPDEARELRAIYYANLIVDLAEGALRAFGADLEVGEAAQLLQLWAHYPQLSLREARAALARFVDDPADAPEPPSTAAQVAKALFVLGAITRGNAHALLDLTTVQLTAAERAEVLETFPAGGHDDDGR